MSAVRARARAALLWAAAASYGIAISAFQQASPEPFAGVLDEHPAIHYATAPTNDPVGRLMREIASGARSLQYRERVGYLESVLDALGVPAESQLLVFSKTGLQRAQTSPRNPRALYFNGTVVVGYIAGARFLELASHDPQQGVVFYTIDQTGASADRMAPHVAGPPSPMATRRTNCLSCHVSSNTLDVPGMITRSMFTARDGDVIPQLGSHLVDHRTPLPQRWGGWFVTSHDIAPPYAGVSHMGNVTTALHPTSGTATTSNEVLFEWLDSAPQSRGYLSQESDIAALMVFDHQMRAINLLTRLNWETRVATSGGGANFGAGPLNDLANELTDYLLFVGEAAPPARMTPRAGFARRFQGSGPQDRRGRSLRELDLKRRLLRYSCSYMIQSDAFASLPKPAKDAVYARLRAILSTGSTHAKYSHLSAEDRRTILEILRDTLPDWPGGGQVSPR
jgi:hypothetical protein